MPVKARGWPTADCRAIRPADRPVGRVIDAARPLLPIRHGIGFNEMMRGRALIQAGQGAAPSLRRASFTVAVTITDLEAFPADPLHPASVSGLVTIAGLTSARGARVATGALRLLARAGRDGQRAMIYRLPFTGIDGQQWALHGSKDIWHATTTLHATAASPGGPGPSAAQAAVSHHREIP